MRDVNVFNYECKDSADDKQDDRQWLLQGEAYKADDSENICGNHWVSEVTWNGQRNVLNKTSRRQQGACNSKILTRILFPPRKYCV